MGKVIRMKRVVPRPSREQAQAGGCIYETGIGHKGKVPFKIFCHKLVEPGSPYCPKHALYVEDEGKEVGRRYAQHKAKREQQEAEHAALALSPLRAENPLFDETVVNTGYQK